MRVTKTTFKNAKGQWVRKCPKCKRVLPLNARVFRRKRKIPLEQNGDYRGVCAKCERAHERATRVQVRTPEQKARYAAYRRRRYAEDPAPQNEALKRYRAKLRQDPERYTRALELRRLAYRLRKEREGAKVVRLVTTAARVHDDLPRLPVAPLVAVLEREVRKIEEEWDGAQVRRGGWNTLAERLGTSSARQFFRWRTGEIKDAQWDTAERVVMALDMDMWMIWSDEELEGRKAA